MRVRQDIARRRRRFFENENISITNMLFLKLSTVLSSLKGTCNFQKLALRAKKSTLEILKKLLLINYFRF